MKYEIEYAYDGKGIAFVEANSKEEALDKFGGFDVTYQNEVHDHIQVNNITVEKTKAIKNQ